MHAFFHTKLACITIIACVCVCACVYSEDEIEEFDVIAGVPGPAAMGPRASPEPVRYIGHNPFLDVSQ